MNIYLIRHTKVQIGQEICYGSSDIYLENGYLKNFEIIKNKIEKDKNTVVYSSSLSRTKLLADYLSEGNYYADKRLNELDFGKWEMLPWDKIPVEDFNKWVEDFETIKCPDGESLNDLYFRVISVFKEVVNSKQDKIIIVSHSSPIKVILSYILEIPLKKAINIDIDYGSISLIEHKYNHLIVKGINI